jgi:hypothetical protein
MAKTSSNVDSKVKAAQKNLKPQHKQFPSELPIVHFLIEEMEWKSALEQGLSSVRQSIDAADFSTAAGRSSFIKKADENAAAASRRTLSKLFSGDTSSFSTDLNLKGSYRLPLPLQLEDKFPIQYGTGYSLAEQTAGVVGKAVVGAGNRIAQPAGYLVNNFRTVVLNQPQFRRHQLNWKLSPRNYQESVALQSIAYGLRKAMTPKMQFGKFVLRFPRIFLMSFTPNPKFLFKFKPCVLENLTVNYNGGNPVPSFYKPEGDPGSGNIPPETLVISTSWIELEYWVDTLDSEESQLPQSDYKFSDDGSGLPSNDAKDVYNYYNLSDRGPGRGYFEG